MAPSPETEAVVLVSGGFDLSVGSVIGFSGMITGLAVLAGAPPALALLVGIGVGATVGVINGLLVAKVGINPLITTLGTMTAVASLTLVVTRGAPVSMFPKGFLNLGQGQLAGVPYLIITAILVTLVGDFLMRRLRLSLPAYRDWARQDLDDLWAYVRWLDETGGGHVAAPGSP